MPEIFHQQRRRARARQRRRAEALFFLWSMRALSRPFWLLLLVLALGTTLLRATEPGAEGEPIGWHSAFMTTYGLLLGEQPGITPETPMIGEIVRVVWPVLGILVFAEGVIKLGLTVFRKEENKEAWVEILARASRGHVILCGVGNVGFRTLEELLRLGEQVIAIERDAACPFLDRARGLGAEVFVGDARDEAVLRKLNVDAAAAVIIATNDDLANLEIAMDVRELRADVPIVMRLFDQALARKVRGALGVDVSVSTSALAAPLFASAALDRSVVATHRVGEEVMVVSEQTLGPSGRLVGMTVAGALEAFQLTVVARRPADGGAWQLQPPANTRLCAGDRVQLMVHSRRLHGMHALSGDDVSAPETSPR